MKNLAFFLLFLSLNSSAWAASETTSSWKVIQSCEYITDELILKLEDEIRPPLAENISDLIANCPRLKTLQLRLNSFGGGIYETQLIVSVLDQAKSRGITVITRVENGDECDSNCVPLFAQGQKRQAGEVAAFMFHGVASWVVTNIPNAKDTEDMLVMIRRGAKNSWLEKLKSQGVFSEPGMYWMSGKELVVEGSGLVTELLSRRIRSQAYDKTYRAL